MIRGLDNIPSATCAARADAVSNPLAVAVPDSPQFLFPGEGVKSCAGGHEHRERKGAVNDGFAWHVVSFFLGRLERRRAT